MLQNQDRLARAVIFIFISMLLFALQAMFVKQLGDRYPVQQIASYRNLFGLLPSILMLYLSANWHANGRSFKMRQWKLAIMRGFYIAAAQFCYYLAITKMELATASTLTYITPLLITILAIPILGHKVGIWRWMAVGVGLLGVMMIMAPGSEVFSPYSLLPLAAAFGYSLSTVLVQCFDSKEPTALINMYASSGALIGSLLLLIFTSDYIPVASLDDWLLLLCMGLVGGCAVLAMIYAYRLTRPANLAPFEYFGIPVVFIIGWIAFAETPFDKLIPGVFLIIGGGLLIAWRERKNFSRKPPSAKE